jgi:hypothetical protein
MASMELRATASGGRGGGEKEHVYKFLWDPIPPVSVPRGPGKLCRYIEVTQQGH